MNIRSLSDKQLHLNLLTLKSKESHIVAKIISHLEEVYRRRLFAHHKCSSIYDYCIRILGYSNGEAHRKVSTCKLASHYKGVKESIASGELSLSNAASVQVFLNQSKKLQNKTQLGDSATRSSDAFLNTSSSSSVANRELNPRSIIERVKNKSTRECEIELEKIASENHLKRPEKKPSKRNYGDKTLLKVYLDCDKLRLLKSRLNINCEQELFESLMEEKLKATEPQTEIKPRVRKQPSKKPRSISPSKRATVFKRAQRKCENCNSKYHLQIDHKITVAQGGSNAVENLRVLCRSCNQRAAIDQLGLTTMSPFINNKHIPSKSLSRRVQKSQIKDQ